MNVKPKMPTPSETDERKQYASRDEVEQAINALTDADYAKLMLIAASFCKRRKFSDSVLEPRELLSEAALKTLQLEKRWSKQVPLIRHLDRAMENISGHLAGQRSRIFPLPDGLTVKSEEPDEKFSPYSPLSMEESQKAVHDLLSAIFGEDDEAADIFVHRVEGIEIAEVLTAKKLNQQQYETIQKRIRRKLAIFLKNQNIN